MANLRETRFKSALEFPVRPLTVCLERIAEQRALLQAVQAALPSEMAQHAQHCLLKDGQLLIYTDSPLWASQIRFFSEVILNKIRQSGQGKVLVLQLRIIPARLEQSVVRQPNRPKAETVRQLGSHARHDSADPLDKSLCRLFETLEKRVMANRDG